MLIALLRVLIACFIPISIYSVTPLPRSASAPLGTLIPENEWKIFDSYVRGHAGLLNHAKTTHTFKVAGVPYKMERDPQTKLLFVHLQARQDSYLGDGAHKIVTKSIMYNPLPVMVAHCESDETGLVEVTLMKKLQGTQGIVKMFTSIDRGHDRHGVFLEYCNYGTLIKSEEGVRVDPKSHLAISEDIICAIDRIHELGYYHRDLHRGNILLHQNVDGSVRAFVTDFGQALRLTQKRDEKLFVSRMNFPPEALLHPYKKIDRVKGETYVVGIALHILHYLRKPVWCFMMEQVKFKYDKKKDMKAKHKILLQQYRASYLNRPKEGFDRDFTLLIHKMLHPNPEKRISLKQALVLVRKLRQKWDR